MTGTSYYLLKIGITTLLVVLISEIAKYSTLFGAILASIPLVSVLAMIWLYIDTGDTGQVSELATSIFWLVIPSLALFISLPLLLKQGVGFYVALGSSVGITVACYILMAYLLNQLGVKL